MKSGGKAQSTTPIPFPVSAGDVRKSGDKSPENESHRLAEGWRRLSTGLRGTRLYRVVPPKGGDAHWQAEMTLNGEVQHRRFASELHARWWLAVLNESLFTPSMLDWEELNAPARAGFARSD